MSSLNNCVCSHQHYGTGCCSSYPESCWCKQFVENKASRQFYSPLEMYNHILYLSEENKKLSEELKKLHTELDKKANI